MFHIYVGPNGFGKTKSLENKKEELVASGIDEKEILFVESELLLMDEVKDSKDTTKTMDFIISEILMSSKDYCDKKQDFEDCVDSIINANKKDMNDMLEEVLSYNNSLRDTKKDFIETTKAKEFKKLVAINAKDIKDKMGSGQRMQLILHLVKKYSSKKYIFLDEPEKYSHPTLLHKTASLLNDLNSKGLEIYVATHSPKLLSMLDLDLESINIINDSTHAIKNINFDEAINNLKFKCLGSLGAREQSYYNKKTLIENLKRVHYKEFLECLFTHKIYLIEGFADKFLLNKVLIDNDAFYDEYVIFQAWGKFVMPVFAEIFKQLNLKIVIYFDKDDEAKPKHKEINDYLLAYDHHQFIKDIEDELGIDKKNNTLEIIHAIDSMPSLKGKYKI